MIRALNLKEVQKVSGGELSGLDVAFDSVSIDTRSLQPGDLFVAISGPNFNGNDFVPDALEKGAVAAVVSTVLNVNLPVLKVTDTRVVLGQIGAMNREASRATVIALTGSQGKTTVKEMVAEILSLCGEVVYTQGNLNNDYGVPLSLLNINSEHDFAVIEIGASGPGEIAYCVALTKPQIAHITNAAATHLEGFGSIEGVAQAKAEIWGGIRDGGIAVINIDDVFGRDWCEQVKDKTLITISAKGNKAADYSLSKAALKVDLTSEFILHTPQGSIPIHLALAGIHNCANALAAAALSMEAGAKLKDVCTGLESVKPVPGRLFHKQGINASTIIDDSYNASPASFRAAIDVLATLPGDKIIAVGDMGELGNDAEAAHRELGRYAKEKGIHCLFATGHLSQLAADSFGKNAVFYSDRSALAEKIISGLNKDVTVLVKGSRSAGMDKLVQLLLGKGE